MTRLAIALLILVSSAQAEPVEVPSGQPVTFVEFIRNAVGSQGLTYRFRFLAPQIARNEGSIDNETAAVDMDFLCTGFAIPGLPATGPLPNRIIISMSDRAVEFGEPAPEVTQFFEAYSVVDNACIWEGI